MYNGTILCQEFIYLGKNEVLLKESRNKVSRSGGQENKVKGVQIDDITSPSLLHRSKYLLIKFYNEAS